MFVDQHLADLSGGIKIDLAEQKNAILTQDVAKNKKTSLNSPDMSATESEISNEPMENWRNKVEKATPLARRSRLSILHPPDPTYVFQGVPLFSNGYSSKKKAGKKILVSNNTCAFDCIYSILATAFVEEKDTKAKMLADKSSFSVFVRHTIEQQDPKSNNKLYEERNEILYAIYSTPYYFQSSIKEDEHIINMDCATTIAPFFEKLIQDTEFLHSVKLTSQCKECNSTKIECKALLPLSAKFFDVQKIEEYSVKTITKYCEGCGNRLKVSKIFNNILAFETEHLDKKNMKRISQLPETLRINKVQYELVLSSARPRYHTLLLTSNVKMDYGKHLTTFELM